MGHLLAAPDKFRDTADAKEVAAACVRAAHRRGWSADAVPLSDGGEGLLDAFGGTPAHQLVTGPLGDQVTAEWRLVDAAAVAGQTGVIEMARAAGRSLLPSPTPDDALKATTAGVGELVLAAVDAGAARIVVGCGGSATTDGGWGAVQAIGSRERLEGARVMVACDVTTGFLQAATVFAPQKGAGPPEVRVLSERLAALAEDYRRDFGVDVTSLAGSGAAGGLAGGLAALGATLVPGFDLVSRLVDLPARLAGAQLVVTGEGHVDPPSLAGKVVGGVLRLAAGRVPVLCVAGDADPATLEDPALRRDGVEVVSLVARAGPVRARRDTAALVEEVVADRLSGR